MIIARQTGVFLSLAPPRARARAKAKAEIRINNDELVVQWTTVPLACLFASSVPWHHAWGPLASDRAVKCLPLPQPHVGISGLPRDKRKAENEAVPCVCMLCSSPSYKSFAAKVQR